MAERTKAADRMARKRQRDRAEKGIVGVLVKVHHTRKAEIREAAAKMQEEAVSADSTAMNE